MILLLSDCDFFPLQCFKIFYDRIKFIITKFLIWSIECILICREDYVEPKKYKKIELPLIFLVIIKKNV